MINPDLNNLRRKVARESNKKIGKEENHTTNTEDGSHHLIGLAAIFLMLFITDAIIGHWLFGIIFVSGFLYFFKIITGHWFFGVIFVSGILYFLF